MKILTIIEVIIIITTTINKLSHRTENNQTTELYKYSLECSFNRKCSTSRGRIDRSGQDMLFTCIMHVNCS